MAHLAMGVCALAVLLPRGVDRMPGWPLALFAFLGMFLSPPGHRGPWIRSIHWVGLVLPTVANWSFFGGYLALLIGRPAAACHIAPGRFMAGCLSLVPLASMADSVLRVALWVAAPAVLALASWKRPWSSTSAS